MKKNLLVTMLVGAVLTVGAATGCGASAPDAEIGVNMETGTNTEESEAVVKPLYPLETAQMPWLMADIRFHLQQMTLLKQMADIN